MRRYFPIFLLFFLFTVRVDAQVDTFQFGGWSNEWSTSDSNTVFVDFNTFPGSIAPTYFNGENILDQLPMWFPFKFPTELDYEDGLIPQQTMRSACTAAVLPK